MTVKSQLSRWRIEVAGFRHRFNGFLFDAGDQLLAGWDIVDQAHNLTSSPNLHNTWVSAFNIKWQ